MPKYDKPNWFIRKIINPVYETFVSKTSWDIGGGWILTVAGRTSGKPRTVPVNLLTLDGSDYLVSPRGETEWVKNLRVAGKGALSKGGNERSFTAVELPDDDKPSILKAYIDRWFNATRGLWEGADKQTPTEQLATHASEHPVFRLEWS